MSGVKCNFCDRVPIRACLMCGVFYCEEHGDFKEKNVAFRQAPFLNSLCRDCKEKNKVSRKSVVIIFGIIGSLFASMGLALVVGMGQFLPGGIFLIQGGVFLMATLFVYLKGLNSHNDKSF